MSCFVRVNELHATPMLPDRLLDMAVRGVGANGRGRVSTRRIAAAGDMAMSSNTNHGGKEGRYLAAADHGAARLASDTAAPMPTQYWIG